MSDEHTVAIVNFEGHVKRAARRVREALAKDDRIRQLRIDIEISGPITGELLIVYKLSDGGYNDDSTVKGHSLDSCVEEFMRRKGWDSTHAPKSITYEEIPF